MMDFLKLVDAECQGMGIDLHLTPTDQVYMEDNGAPCAGFFDDKHSRLACAMGRIDWAEILAHEFSHLMQFKEGLFKVDPEDDPYDLLEEWYAGADHSPERVAAAIRFAVECELDAEKRAVGYICKYRLSHNMAEYIQEANGYVLRYLYAQKTRKWPESPVWGDLLPKDRIVDLDELKLTKPLEKLIAAAQPDAKKKKKKKKRLKLDNPARVAKVGS